MSARVGAPPPGAPTAIVSWDGTANDRDALALGRLLATAGARLSLAYVRHPVAGRVPASPEHDEALALLRRGALELDLPQAPLHVVDDASTGEGLRALAERERAGVVVFGSDYRTAPGEVRPGPRRSACWRAGRWRSRSRRQGCATARTGGRRRSPCGPSPAMRTPPRRRAIWWRRGMRSR